MLTVSGCARDEPEQPTVRPRNLILISLDTVRADHLGCYGYDRPTTPRIDAYAKTGTLFENCTSSSSWTVPAHLTMFTGLEPATHRCVYYPEPGRLNNHYDTMARILGRHGFRSGAFTGGAYASARYGLNVGFDSFQSKGRRFEYNIPPAKRWLEKNADQPFFLFLHGFNAHRPYIPPAPYDTRFSDGYSGSYNIREFGPGKQRPSPEDLTYVVSQYDGEIGFVDEMIGDFIAYLEKRGLMENTLVILTSDHGDEFYEHGGCDHISTLYDELTHVPLILLGPGIPAQRLPHHVGTIDILPTVLALFGLESERPFHGADRSGMIRGRKGTLSDAVFMYTGMGNDPKHLSGLRTQRWKLVVNLPGAGVHPACSRCKKGTAEGRQIELYDLQADPLELTNVVNTHADVARDLYARLQNRLAECEVLRLGTETSLPASPEHLQELQSLGYIGGN